MSRKTPLPESLRRLFWDYDFSRLSWDGDRDLVTARVLAAGSWRDIGWLRSRLGDETLAAWITARRGRGLSPQQLRFWELILGLPTADVDAWLEARRSDPWDRRQAS